MARTMKIVAGTGPAKLAPTAPTSAAPKLAQEPAVGASVIEDGILPAAPLAEMVRARGGIGRCTSDAALARAYHRGVAAGGWRSEDADRLAVGLLGDLPFNVWGWAAWTAAARADNDEPDDEPDDSEDG